MTRRLAIPIGYVALMAMAYVAGVTLHLVIVGIDWSDIGLGPRACRSDNIYLDALVEAGSFFAFLAFPMLAPTALALWHARRIGHRSHAGLPFAALGLTAASAFAVKLIRDLEFIRLCETGAFSSMAGEDEGGKPLFVEWPELPAWMAAIEPIPGYVMLTAIPAVLFVAARLARRPLAHGREPT